MRRGAPDRYRDILDAAERVIARQGYAGAQVSRIAREAGVAGGTVYLYFANKKDLLVSLFRERFGRFIEALDAAMAEAASAPEALRRLVGLHLGMLGERPELAAVTQIEMRQADPEIRRGIDDALRPYFERIDAVLRRGIEEGAFDGGMDMRVAKRMIFGTLDQCVTAWVMSGYRYDLAALVEPVCRLLLQGLGGGAGGGRDDAKGAGR
ncbi:MAG: TetR/AcrR family transcriptional regulator [Firmicutes bacterium]|nr:TetR/AcrR family transcriptional regulator [Bacillota bacterium]